jgi:hypothetical protein
MAHASKKHIGAGAKGKGDGTGARTETAEVAELPENMVLSNRDKSQHSSDRGQDTKWVQTEQLHDHEANQRKR